MRSKLEPGCTAIIIKGNYSGKLLKCIKFIGKPEPVNRVPFAGNDYWEVDQNLRFTLGDYHNLCSASIMQRIDDDSEPETIEESELIETEA